MLISNEKQKKNPIVLWPLMEWWSDSACFIKNHFFYLAASISFSNQFDLDAVCCIILQQKTKIDKFLFKVIFIPTRFGLKKSRFSFSHLLCLFFYEIFPFFSFIFFGSVSSSSSEIQNSFNINFSVFSVVEKTIN